MSAQASWQERRSQLNRTKVNRDNKSRDESSGETRRRTLPEKNWMKERNSAVAKEGGEARSVGIVKISSARFQGSDNDDDGDEKLQSSPKERQSCFPKIQAESTEGNQPDTAESGVGPGNMVRRGSVSGIQSIMSTFNERKQEADAKVKRKKLARLKSLERVKVRVGSSIKTFDEGKVNRGRKKTKKELQRLKSLEVLPELDKTKQTWKETRQKKPKKVTDKQYKTLDKIVNVDITIENFNEKIQKINQRKMSQVRKRPNMSARRDGSSSTRETTKSSLQSGRESSAEDGLELDEDDETTAALAEEIEKKSSIPVPGESLTVEPFGSMKISAFEEIYILGDIINAGHFGSVYKAHHVNMNKSAQVAVKVVDRVLDSKFEDEVVIQESKIMRDMRDISNIVKIFDFYMDDEKMYVVQELAAGGDVFDRLIEKKNYAESNTRELSKVLLQTITSLHGLRLVHRDLKPENLLLKNTKSDTAILLCDFGFAKYLPEDGSGLWTHCGTPAFTAPEIVNGVEYKYEVDMWSVGCVLFMLLCGEEPFQGSEMDLYQFISTADYGFDQSAWKFVSEEAKDLISQLLILDVSKRLSAKEALEHGWFTNVSSMKLKKNNLKASLAGLKDYNKNVRPKEKKQYIDTEYVGDEDYKYITPPKIPIPGESLNVSPLGTPLGEEGEIAPFDRIYQLGKIINKGNFGIKYSAYHVSNQPTDLVTVSVIPRNETTTEAFIYQATILKSIRYVPNIVKLCDFYMDRDNMYVVHEVTEGGDILDRLLEKSIYKESDARVLFRNLLVVIQNIHKKKLIHRNLKPENLILKNKTNDTDVFLGGFGYAKFLPKNSARGLTTRCGTPSFVAPEIIEGVEYWEEVDMWSIGCILYMILGGYKPFQGTDEFDLYHLVATADWNFNEPTWDVISPEAKDLISNLLVLDRKKRFTVKQALESDWIMKKQAVTKHIKSRLAHQQIPPPGASLQKDYPLGKLEVPFSRVYKFDDDITSNSSKFGTDIRMYRGHHTLMKPLEHEVTIKVVKRNGEHDEALIRDTSILKGLRDIPEILPILDFYVDEEHIYAIYEYKARCDVFDRLLEKKTYKEIEARKLMKLLLSGVQSIHEKNLIHRNLKPENLLLQSADSDFSILLGGFNYAKYLPSGDDEGCGLWTLCGTPFFSAPEIVDGVEYFEEVDMWSIGCIIFMLLSGDRPFDGSTTYETYELISAGDYGFDSPTWDVVTDQAKDFTKQLLCLDKSDRLSATQALDHPWMTLTRSGSNSYARRHMSAKSPSAPLAVPEPGRSMDVYPFGSLRIQSIDKVYKKVKNSDVTIGSFGSVYQAHHVKKKPTDLVTVRVISKEDMDEETLIRETLILKDLRDLSHVTRLSDFYITESDMYVMMDCTIAGDVFDKFFEIQTYTESDGRALMKRLLQTIESLHQRKLVHRNLKPENLFLVNKSTTFDMILGGFGYAKYLPEDERSGLWTHCGTPAYTAPEIVDGVEYWSEVDMWSVGCILFTLLGGYQPFEGENEIEIYQYISTADYGFDEPIWENISKEARDFISHLLILGRKNRLTATDALKHDWMMIGSKTTTATTSTARSSSVPNPGDSLRVQPLGSLNVKFKKVYQLLDELSTGSFGVAYRGHHVNMPKSDLVVVKVVSKDDSEEQAVLDEISILMDFSDVRTIVKLCDYYVDKHNMYVVHEYAAGGDVFDRLTKKGPMKEKDARELSKILLRTVHILHGRKLIHRNLKPENLFLKSKNNIQDILLGGFNYSKYLPKHGARGLWTICGTPMYTAPEIINGVEYWEEVDMWSVGCIIYMTLCGNFPFQGKSTMETYQLITTCDYGFDDPIWNSIGRQGKHCISNLLVLDRKKRMTAAGALKCGWFFARM